MKKSIPYLCFILLVSASRSYAEADYEREPVNYLKVKESNRVTQLQEWLNTGKTTLAYDDEKGYLKSLLKALNVPESSQMLVFSKTSFQARYITPETPRAVYFSDDMYIGYTQNGDVLEISAVDPVNGPMFYALDQKKIDKPQFKRLNHDCLRCHGSSLTHNSPGHIVRSVFTNDEGFPILKAGTFVTDHRSPIEERWGGWYVTGTHGDVLHMGNQIAQETEFDATINRTKGANVTDLSTLIDTTPYLTAHSDLVALMVLEHQAEMHNLLTRANFDTRKALHHQEVMDNILKREKGELSELTERIIKSSGTRLLNYMLFVDEAPLTAEIKGTSGFAEEFQAQGKRDRENRSLREFDLEERMFKYPCSYLIHSKAFDELPGPMKDYLYRRLYEVLTNQDTGMDFAHLSRKTCRTIFNILLDTKPDLPAYWRDP